jgi:hypothetical protein
MKEPLIPVPDMDAYRGQITQAIASGELKNVTVTIPRHVALPIQQATGEDGILAAMFRRFISEVAHQLREANIEFPDLESTANKQTLRDIVLKLTPHADQPYPKSN